MVVAETATLEGGRAGASGAYLLVIQAASATIVPLPNVGTFTIGRASDIDLQLDHASVSRRHARIVVESGEVRVSDLESRNGTRVNNELLHGPRTLANGDTVAIGEVILVLHARHQSKLEPLLLDEASWRRRLSDEVERATTFGRSLAVLSIAATSAELGTVLRTIDVIGSDRNGGLMALLPEADATAALELAHVALRAVGASAPEARVGVALCPSDATDADGLVMAARAALSMAAPKRVGRATEAVERLVLGNREVLVCHPAMVRVFDLLKRLAGSSLPVLIVGETGVGKENAAYAVHHYSPRAAGPFHALNCAALPESLVESQLFGHDKGAFTGAVSAHAGIFEAASGGTLFLDEVTELATPIQAKLLRALETQRITRVGETREREVDVRIVAATNRALDEAVVSERFRQDLYFRIGAARVHLPPLRDRRCEIPLLFRDFIAKAARRDGREPPEPTPEVFRHLLAYPWPGNVRELKHVAEYATAIVEDDRIEIGDLPLELAARQSTEPPVARGRGPAAPMRRLSDEIEEFEQQRMIEALGKTGGIKTRAAALLGMPIRTFNMKIKKYRI